MADRELHREGTDNRVEGAAEELKGKVRGKLGDLTDDQSEQLKGKGEELKGKVQKKFGEAQQDAARDEKI
jgi:uncharacterized protein YjbJ (UPF0337 family)